LKSFGGLRDPLQFSLLKRGTRHSSALSDRIGKGSAPVWLNLYVSTLLDREYFMVRHPLDKTPNSSASLDRIDEGSASVWLNLQISTFLDRGYFMVRYPLDGTLWVRYFYQQTLDGLVSLSRTFTGFKIIPRNLLGSACSVRRFYMVRHDCAELIGFDISVTKLFIVLCC
jgi:hypothetical protein